MDFIVPEFVNWIFLIIGIWLVAGLAHAHFDEKDKKGKKDRN